MRLYFSLLFYIYIYIFVWVDCFVYFSIPDHTYIIRDIIVCNVFLSLMFDTIIRCTLHDN
jgi:hypothetical protein